MKILSVRMAVLACVLDLAAAHGVTAAEPPARPLAGTAVDTCVLLKDSDASAILGKLAKPTQQEKADGSQLGACDYYGATVNATVTAHPADELDGTVSRDL